MRNKTKPRRQKVLILGVIALILAALVALVLGLGRVHTLEGALRASEDTCGTRETEPVAEMEVGNATFCLSRNESTLLVTWFKPWMHPEEAFVGAIDLTKTAPDEHILGGWRLHFKIQNDREYALVFGQSDLEPADTLRAHFYETGEHLDSPVTTTQDGRQYFLLVWDGPIQWQGNGAVASLPNFNRLALLDKDGKELYSFPVQNSFPPAPFTH